MKAMKLMVLVTAVGLGVSAFAGNLILVGDSTLAPRKVESPNGSWGDSMTNSLSEGWTICNFAIGGKTVKTIQEGGRNPAWKRALEKMGKDDFVIVQFGINDASKKKLVEIPQFKAEFAKFADQIRAKGAIPVFCSPIQSGAYGRKTGLYQGAATRVTYGTAIKEVAEEKKVDFVDMTAITATILGGLKQAEGEALFIGKTTRDGKPTFDTTHPCKAGARLFGSAFVKEVKARNLPIAKVFK